MNRDKELARQMECLKFGATEITPRNEFSDMLQQSIDKKTPLRIKCGIDPTSSKLHLGHTVPYRKMRQFQDMGHTGVVVIGDYTASIGDPSGREESRPHLELKQVKKNAKTYMDQLFTILDPGKTEVRHQSEWFLKTSLSDILKWASQTSTAKLLGHETFKLRLEKGLPLSLHELLYPVLQGMDSVFVKADVELGGTDQRFNVLMGRDYQRIHNLRPQAVMLLPLITGTCGKYKMSKSQGNTIDLQDEPFEKFGKVMSIPDHCLLEYFRYLADISPQEFANMEKMVEKREIHLNEAKKQLATNIVTVFNGKEAGRQAREQFETVFKRREVPDKVPKFQFDRESELVSILAKSGILPSKNEARRMVRQNAVNLIDGKKTTRLNDENLLMGDHYKGKILKVGKRKFLKLV